MRDQKYVAAVQDLRRRSRTTPRPSGKTYRLKTKHSKKETDRCRAER